MPNQTNNQINLILIKKKIYIFSSLQKLTGMVCLNEITQARAGEGTMDGTKCGMRRHSHGHIDSIGFNDFSAIRFRRELDCHSNFIA